MYMLLIENRYIFVTKLEFNGGELSLKKFAFNQIGFSHTLISRNYAKSSH